jgi:hypothetical protein
MGSGAVPPRRQPLGPTRSERDRRDRPAVLDRHGGAGELRVVHGRELQGRALMGVGR